MLNFQETVFLIRDAMIYDGSGTPPFQGSVLVEKDRIRLVTKNLDFSGRAIPEISAKGLALAPGFIDAHSHSDLSILAAPEAFGKVSQGITTEIVGNCGLSVFPVPNDEVREHLNELYSSYNEKITWKTLQGYAAEWKRRSPCVNFLSLCGHNTLRAGIAGYTDVPVDRHMLAAMQENLAHELKSGACGLSSGLLYIPGKFSTSKELAKLMETLGNYKRLYATHLRNEGSSLLEALDEAVGLARNASVQLQVSHLKTALPENWHKLPQVFEKIEAARAEGLTVFADRYPYTYGQTSLSVILPPPYDKMPDKTIINTLSNDPEACQKLCAELEKHDFWDGIIFTNSSLPEYEHLGGLKLNDAAKLLNRTPAALTVELMKRDAVGTMAAFGGLSQENMERILSQDWVCCGTDENARPPDYSIGRSHPRAFGSFPRFIGIVRKQTSLAEAIRKTTSLPAAIFKIPERGLIREGYYADLLLFDENKLSDTATFSVPHSPADGICTVWVNGKAVYDTAGKAQTGKGGGRFLFAGH